MAVRERRTVAEGTGTVAMVTVVVTAGVAAVLKAASVEAASEETTELAVVRVVAGMEVVRRGVDAMVVELVEERAVLAEAATAAQQEVATRREVATAAVGSPHPAPDAASQSSSRGLSAVTADSVRQGAR